MANFTLIIDSGAGIATWEDPAVTGKPARLNPVAGIPHRNHTVTEAAALTLHALVGGALVADAGLGGELFIWSWVDVPDAGAPIPIAPTAGTTAEVAFGAAAFAGRLGHYTILAHRANGGSMGLSFEVVA